MISEIRRNSPVQAIGRLSHSEGAPGIKVKAATWLSKMKESANKDGKKLKRTNMSQVERQEILGYEKRKVRAARRGTDGQRQIM